MRTNEAYLRKPLKPGIFLTLSIATALMLVYLFGGQVKAIKAAGNTFTLPTSGNIGTTFVLQGYGFNHGEKVILWSTNPDGVAAQAGYTFADNDGKINLHVETTDPGGLTTIAGGNVTLPGSDVFKFGNTTDSYLRIILQKASPGTWNLTAHGTTTDLTEVFTFSITGPAVAYYGPSAPAVMPQYGAGSVKPDTGALGTFFTLYGTGFKPFENVSFWTKDPKGVIRGAGYTYTDPYGNFKVVVVTKDLADQATSIGTNFTEQVVRTDANGKVLENFLRMILYKPVVGDWTITAQSVTTGQTQYFNFKTTL